MNIQCYGGGLWRTWFDRDLGLAGKIVIRTADGKLRSELWDSKAAVMNVANLCIHLDRQAEFNPNKENHLKPILATSVIDQLMGQGIEKIEEDVFRVEEKHYSTFL